MIVSYDMVMLQKENIELKQEIENLKITHLACTCGEKLTLICKKKTPLYYIFRHICAELDMEIHGCEKCGLKVAKVPEQIFRETKEQQEEYIKEVMKGVSIL